MMRRANRGEFHSEKSWRFKADEVLVALKAYSWPVTTTYQLEGFQRQFKRIEL
jgi:hypothetical protein